MPRGRHCVASLASHEEPSRATCTPSLSTLALVLSLPAHAALESVWAAKLYDNGRVHAVITSLLDTIAYPGMRPCC